MSRIAWSVVREELVSMLEQERFQMLPGQTISTQRSLIDLNVQHWPHGSDDLSTRVKAD